MKNMKQILSVTVLSVIALVLLGGCGSHEAPEMNDATLGNVIVGKVWYLDNIFGREANSEEPMTIKFAADNTVSGFAGCNNFSGEYTQSGESLKFGPMVTTRKACGASLSEQEYTFLTLMSAVDKVRLVDGELHLLSIDHGGAIAFTLED